MAALRLVKAALGFSRRRRRWVILTAAVGMSGYGAYRIYHLPSVVRKRRKLARLYRGLIAIVDAVASSAETVSLVSSDLNSFLRSDSDEIPRSLRQISKLSRSEEFLTSLSTVTEAVTKGLTRALSSGSETELIESETRSSSFGLSDRVLDKLFSSSGTGFASVVVGSFAKNLVIAFYSAESRSSSVSDDPTAGEPRWLQFLTGDKGKELIASCIQVFVSKAVTVYLDRTPTVSSYDQLISGITNPKHEAKVKELLVSVCNGAVETLVRSSHQVMTAPSSSTTSSSVSSVVGVSVSDQEGRRNKSSEENQSKDCGGWVKQVSSTLAVPSNRRLVLDLTGRMTFEMVKSFLDFLMRRLSDGARKSISFAREEVVERGLEVVRYLSAKTVAIFTVCLALCVQVSIGTRLLMPA
ncbi:protein PHLOEM PROTEIN 2-LIKE A10-like [Typha angustifolia]|uniref:protein PHLOEM PROTEIN 2-LIKE A10-like n=1 Tax=Typha angustifolia TaxID=59011 RepID=UPI003C2BFF89